jgi:RND family efflux transporter MFP subunit
MASKVIYTVVAIVGIAAASGYAWWHQSKPQGPREMTGSGPAAASTGGAAGPAGAASAPRAAGVEVAKVERATLRDDAQSVGSLRSRQSVMMRPEVAGRIREIGFSDGATVRKGQLLVQLDDTLQRAEIKQARAQVSIAQANFRRNEELVAQSFVARRVLDESAANLQVAEAQLALACARLSRMAIVAPFDGTVGIRNINLGDYVKDGADLINLEDISSMYVDFRMPERFQNKLRMRQTVELQLDSMPGRVFKATVEAIDPLLDVNGRSVGVRAVLPNTQGETLMQPGGGRPGGNAGAGGPAAAAGGRPGAGAGRPNRAPGAAAAAAPVRPAAAVVDTEGCPTQIVANASAPAAAANPQARPLRPGMFARVTTVFAIKEMALTIPEEAIVPQGGRQFVIKVVEPAALPASQTPRPPLPPDTKFVSLRQEVKLGARQLGKVEITEGVAEGDTVVVAGQQRLQRDGSALRIVELGRPLGAGPSGGPARAASAPGSAATAAASP